MTSHQQCLSDLLARNQLYISSNYVQNEGNYLFESIERAYTQHIVKLHTRVI